MNWIMTSQRSISAALRWVATAAVALLFILAATRTVPAQQSTAPSSESETVKQLLKRVEELEARLKQLEARETEAARPSASTSTATVVAAKEDDAGLAHRGQDQPNDQSHGGSPVLQLRGFGDVSYRASDLRGEKNSFALGQLDLFITSRLSEKFSVLGELVVEANDENEFGFEVERLLLRYSPSDYFNASFGRYHTAIGYYNTAYHHGAWFQTATGRPFIFEFEDDAGILPIHNVGVSATGRIPSGKLGLQYVAELGNGRRSRSPFDEPVQTVVDENNGKAVNLGLFARPEWSPGLQAGLSVYRDKLTPEGSAKFDETIAAMHVVYENSTFEFLNEALLIRHTEQGGRTFNTPGFYSQISRRFAKSRPYFRYQYVNSPDGDPFIGDVGRRNGPSLGLRYDVSEFAAFKAQYDRTERRRLSAVNGLTLQLAFTF